MYGESYSLSSFAAAAFGLSPRVRGILVAEGGSDECGGSIPACTGNPPGYEIPRRQHRVYPRVYGESSILPGTRLSLGGLSPRVRGIRRRYNRYVSAIGSIPACTGNPALPGIGNTYPGVYPRVYGESLRPPGATVYDSGLSPRVRGIHDGQLVGVDLVRSIPACTGNPRRNNSDSCSLTVYPRVYGESRSKTTR